MKLSTAVSHAHRISDRVRSINGVLATPLCHFEAVRFRRIWVFGSTIKGSLSPNDLDLMIDYKIVGRRRTWRQTKVDREYLRTYGHRKPPRSDTYAFIWLTKGMTRISRHTLEDSVPIDKMVMIYPRNDLPLFSEWPATPDQFRLEKKNYLDIQEHMYE